MKGIISEAMDIFVVLFNNAVSSSDCTVSRDRFYNGLERIWKEAVVC
jgi:hypothetical protein